MSRCNGVYFTFSLPPAITSVWPISSRQHTHHCHHMTLNTHTTQASDWANPLTCNISLENWSLSKQLYRIYRTNLTETCSHCSSVWLDWLLYKTVSLQQWCEHLSLHNDLYNTQSVKTSILDPFSCYVFNTVQYAIYASVVIVTIHVHKCLCTIGSPYVHKI